MTTRTLQSRSAAWPRLVDVFDTLVPWDFDRAGRLAHSMRVEEFRRDGSLVIRAELPGFDPEKDIDISITDGVLTIEASREEREESEVRSEFHYGRFARSLTLPQGVDETSVAATYGDGILEVTVEMPAAKPVAAPEAVHVPIARSA